MVAKKRTYYAFVGTWQYLAGHGRGIHVYRIEPESGLLTQVEHIEEPLDASMLALDTANSRVFAAIESRRFDGRVGSGGAVASFRFDPRTETLTQLSLQPAMGSCTNYSAVSPDGRYVLVSSHGHTHEAITRVRRTEQGWEWYAQFDDPTAALFRVNADGMLEGAADVVAYQGHGPCRFQEAAFTHSTAFDPTGQYAVVCVPGSDAIISYRVTDRAGQAYLTECFRFQSRPGSAPRHIAFHPTEPYFFVSNEIGLTVSSLRLEMETGQITEVERQRTVPQGVVGYEGEKASAVDVAVHPNGSTLYVSNRSGNGAADGVGAYSLSTYAIREGKLCQIGFTTLPKGPPRGLCVFPEGRFLYVTNTMDDSITRLLLDADTGLPSAPKEVATPDTPVCIRIGAFDAESEDANE